MTSPNLSPKSTLFLEMMMVERGAALNTLEAYRRDLTRFSVFLKSQNLTPEDAQKEHLQTYLATLYDANISPRSLSRILSCLKQFYKFLVLEQGRSDNPTATLSRPKTKATLPKILSEDHVRALLITVRQGKTPEDLRMACLLEILYATGLRVSELISLTLTHTVNQPSMLLVRGKGNKERFVPMNQSAWTALQKYVAVRPHFLPPRTQSPWLFPSYGQQKHLTRQRFGQLLKQLALDANLDPASLSPHVVRHAFATHLLVHGADLVSIQKMLGHQDISTTQIYTHVATEKLMTAVKNHHPLNKKI